MFSGDPNVTLGVRIMNDTGSDLQSILPADWPYFSTIQTRTLVTLVCRRWAQQTELHIDSTSSSKCKS